MTGVGGLLGTQQGDTHHREEDRDA